MKVFEFGTVKEVELVQVIRVKTLMGGNKNSPGGLGSDVNTYWTLDGQKIGEIDPRKPNPFPIEPSIDND